jgi:tRNA threonylcarbamoyl adenosine modification protein YjeE
VLAAELSARLAPGHRVLLEGPMGVGKTTFSRALLEGLGVEQPPEGSPSFALAHEYLARGRGEVIHIDFYRIRGEQEIQDAGIESYFWERKAIVLAEWTSLWPEFERAVLRGSGDEGQNVLWRVELAFAADDPQLREVRILRG